MNNNMERVLQEYCISKIASPEKSDSREGLGYALDKRGKLSKYLFHEASLKSFIKERNEKSFNKVLLQEYDGNENDFFHDYQKKMFDFFYKENINISIAFKKGTRSFKFKNEEFIIFDQLDLNKNKWVLIDELDILNGYKRVDLVFCVNGIVFSLLELKSGEDNQYVEKGIDKIIQDYFDLIQKESDSSYPNYLIYEKCLFLMSGDNFQAAINRSLCNLSAQAKESVFKEYGKETVKDKIKKCFEYYFKEGKFEDVSTILESLYFKESIYKDIFIFNYSIRISENKKEMSQILFSPRVKQKEAVEKIINDLKDRLHHEKDPDYVINKEIKMIREKVKDENIINEIKNNRLEYNNDREIDSYLLQYSAGFGKTMIMCWLIMALNELEKRESELYTKNSSEKLYDKIIVVTDRVDLNEQFKKNFSNVDFSGIKDVRDEKNTTKKLENFLLDEGDSDNFEDRGSRVMLVTVQSFSDNSIKRISSLAKEKIKNKRVAFIIDEVHRTQNGDLNTNLQETFKVDDALMKSLTGNISNNNNGKNLVIGLTATPKKETIQKYGHFKEINENGEQIFEAFDSYPLKQAIKDGFVLNPVQKVLRMNTSVINVVVNDGKEEDIEKHYYEDSKRINQVSQEISKVLKGHTFKKINNQGQAMLVVKSKKVANKFREELVSLLGYKKVFTLYTEDQANEKLENLNKHVFKSNNDIKKSIINEFCKSKQSIIIVVDMLQTGFDNPKLHTLFLDKVVRDIPAVQLGCRINRIYPGKNDCLIIDSSYHGENMEELKKAFKKYEEINISELDCDEVIESLKRSYSYLINSDIYKTALSMINEKEKYRKDYEKNIAFEKEKINYLNKESKKIEVFKKEAQEYRNNYEKIIGIKSNVSNFRIEKLKKVLDFLTQRERELKNSEVEIFYSKTRLEGDVKKDLYFNKIKNEYFRKIFEKISNYKNKPSSWWLNTSKKQDRKIKFEMIVDYLNIKDLLKEDMGVEEINELTNNIKNEKEEFFNIFLEYIKVKQREE